MTTCCSSLKCVSFVLCSIFTLSAQSAKDVKPSIPSWLDGRGELLPNLTMETISRIESAWPKLELSDTGFTRPSQEYLDALRVFVELGEQGVLALVWIYAQEPPRLAPYKAISKSGLIRTVFLRDTTSEKWVLPLLRHRLKWMENLSSAGNHVELSRLGDELGAIQGYMNVRGEDQDFRNVMDLINNLAVTNDAIRQELGVLIGEKYERTIDESRRKSQRAKLFPYHEWAKLALASRLEAQDSGPKAEAVMPIKDKSNVVPQVSPQAPKLNPLDISPKSEAKSMKSWIIFALLAASLYMTKILGSKIKHK